MSERDGTQSSTKQRRSRKTDTTNQQYGKQATTVRRPTINDTEAWKAYWEGQGQSWRTEPEIDEKRQKYLTERRSITPDIRQGIYPFKDIKLSRADVEWLLATHENGRGPIDWNDGIQRERQGLDLRGANLCHVDLHSLPLARLRGGLIGEEWRNATEEQRYMAAVLMQGANLMRAHLERASFRWAHLENTDFRWGEIERANFRSAHLEGANFSGAHLEGATLKGAYLERTILNRARLERAQLDNLILSSEERIGPYMADVQWGNANLSTVKWSQIAMLGDEFEARQKLYAGKIKDRNTSLQEYEEAVRANRQLAVVLRNQGLNEEADHFDYRAQLLQRVVWRLQRRPLKFILSWFLYLLAGYGYRPMRSLLWYLVIIIGFALAYFAFGHIPPLEAFVFSLTSFHGRGFFPGGNISLSDPRVVVAAFEAVVGLLIEISFIATFTQRFFGK